MLHHDQNASIKDRQTLFWKDQMQVSKVDKDMVEQSNTVNLHKRESLAMYLRLDQVDPHAPCPPVYSATFIVWVVYLKLHLALIIHNSKQEHFEKLNLFKSTT